MAHRRKETAVTLSPKVIQARIFGARSVILVAVILTVINLAVLLINTGDPILFTVSVPYYLVVLGLGLDNGMGTAAAVEDGPTAIGGYTIAALAGAVAILVVCMLCWYLSQKRKGWMTAALVIFVVDTVALTVISVVLLGSPSYVVVDMCIHIWILFLLALGNNAAKQQRVLERQEPGDFGEEM